MAARSENEGTSDGETYIEKYTRGVLQVENILSLERLRQARKGHFLYLWNWIMRIQVELIGILINNKHCLLFSLGALGGH